MTRHVFMTAVAVFTSLIAVDSASAELWTPSIFGSGMVLQRNQPLPVWGEADAGQEVSVAFAGQTKTAKANGDGAWTVTLDAVEASAEPRSLSVSAGDETKTFDNVLVGEVWICSGQSNMKWSVNSALEAELEIAAANFPEMRLFLIPQVPTGEPKKDVDAQWQTCSPATVPSFSAVAYFFGRSLHKTLNVPIGLVEPAWGGTRAEAWTPEDALRAVPELAPILDTWDARAEKYDAAAAKANHEKGLAAWEPKMKAWRERYKKNPASAGRAPRRPALQTPPSQDRHRYSTLWNGMTAAVVPYAAKGAIWYQGESNAGRAYQYRTLMKTLIESWQQAWGQDQFAFYQVQLANFMAIQDQPQQSAWAELREAQQIAADAVSDGGVAVITDIGAAKDIHPKDKQNVGKRLARLALVDLYGFNITRSGPTLASASFENGKATLKFDNIGQGGYQGLTSYYGEPLTGFAVAGEDRVWHWGEAKISGKDTVVVTCADVPEPAAVRYNWADNPQGTLFNKAYLPAAPFRTDNWDGVTKNAVNP